MKFDSKAIRNNFSLIIIKNPDLLNSIKDYFYQKLLYEFDHKNIFFCTKNEIDSYIKVNIKTKYVMVIEEGLFLNGYADNDFIRRYVSDLSKYSLIGHLLDRKERYYELHSQHFILNVDDWKKANMPSFLTKQSNNLAGIIRSHENFHDDYTPISVQHDSNKKISCNKMKFGGLVVSELLKKGFNIRPFNNNERHNKKFVYYDVDDQIKNILTYDRLPENSFYYPISTANTSVNFNNPYKNYISVANGIDSLRRIKNVYKSVKQITYYDISITSLIFTEILINKFNNDYKDFVIHFEENLEARRWTTLHADRLGYSQLDQYNLDINQVLPILEHIRKNNIKVNYYFGDITRTSILETINSDTMISLTNAFVYQHNHIRKSEWFYWLNKVKENKNKIDVLC